MKEKSSIWLPVGLMSIFALTRWPGLMPPNFSAAYGLLFCSGVFLPRRLAWWLPPLVMVFTDVALDFYYSLALHINAFSSLQAVNWLVYGLLLWLGTRFRPQTPFLGLLGGGLLGAVLFYLITNTAAWLFNPFQNPEYTRNFLGWLTALTKGTAGYAQTWEFFRNTLLSGGLFTGLFVGAMKLTASAESEQEKQSPERAEEPDQPAPESESEPQAAPEEAKSPAHRLPQPRES